MIQNITSTNEKSHYFKPNLIGEALAYIVSEVEGDEYVYARLNTFKYGWTKRRGQWINSYYYMAIVKRDFKDCNFCLNPNSPWMKMNIALILKMTFTWPSDDIYIGKESVDFENEFKNSIFPYLDDFISELTIAKSEKDELSKEEVIKLAQAFIAKLEITKDEKGHRLIRKKDEHK